MYLVLGSAEWDKTYLHVPQQLDAPRFNQLDSGLFAFIKNGDNAAIWRSLSAQSFTDHDLLSALPTLLPGGQLQGQTTIKGQAFFYLAMGIAWEVKNGTLKPFTFYIAESTQRFNAALAQYRLYLWVGLSIMAGLLLLAFTMLLYWGLSPLSKVAEEVYKIESGAQDAIQGQYPKELTSLTENLNKLVEHEQKQRTRYRNTLSNLAHSLKTPLAVIQGITDQLSHHDRASERNDQTSTTPSLLLNQQVSRMNDIVQHQLQRAVHVAPNAIRKPIFVKPVVMRLASAIEKIYHHKATKVTFNIAEDTIFRGDEGDLMEVLGNIMENAGKYGDGSIHIDAHNITFEQQTKCKFMIEDNGEGIDQDKIEVILTRGVRADEKHQGQGIGLAVVVDIVDLYQGRISIRQSDLGGALFEVTL